jgi:hypothetical protein
MFFPGFQQLIAQHHWHSSHEGATPTGQTLDQYLGSSHDSEFLVFFDKFLGSVYGADFINIFKLNRN